MADPGSLSPSLCDWVASAARRRICSSSTQTSNAYIITWMCYTYIRFSCCIKKWNSNNDALHPLLYPILYPPTGWKTWPKDEFYVRNLKKLKTIFPWHNIQAYFLSIKLGTRNIMLDTWDKLNSKDFLL